MYYIDFEQLDKSIYPHMYFHKLSTFNNKSWFAEDSLESSKSFSSYSAAWSILVSSSSQGVSLRMLQTLRRFYKELTNIFSQHKMNWHMFKIKAECFLSPSLSGDFELIVAMAAENTLSFSNWKKKFNQSDNETNGRITSKGLELRWASGVIKLTQ